jgi:MYXO-CTERM domain-containing protein
LAWPWDAKPYDAKPYDAKPYDAKPYDADPYYPPPDAFSNQPYGHDDLGPWPADMGAQKLQTNPFTGCSYVAAEEAGIWGLLLVVMLLGWRARCTVRRGVDESW